MANPILYKIEYSTDNGATWILAWSSDNGLFPFGVSIEISLPTNTILEKFKVRASTHWVAGWTTLGLHVYEHWVEGKS